MEMKQNNAFVAENETKTLKNDVKEIKMDEKVIKSESNASESEDLKKQYEELKKNKPELIAKTRNVAKGNVTSKQDKPKKGGDKMEKKQETKNWRTIGEEVLLEVCKELKLTPERVAQKSTSNQLGALRVKLGNQVAVAVRATDIIAYNPHNYLGYGYPHEGDWGVWITKLQRCSREEMKKAMVKTLKNKTLPHTYRDNGKFSYKEKANVVKSVTKDAVEAQRKKLADMEAALKADAKAKAKEQKKQNKDAKPKTKRGNVLANVAATVVEPTVA